MAPSSCIALSSMDKVYNTLSSISIATEMKVAPRAYIISIISTSDTNS